MRYLLALLMLPLAAHAAAPAVTAASLQIPDATVQPAQPGQTAAVSMLIENDTSATLTLTGASTPVAAAVKVQRVATNAQGLLQLQPEPALQLPPHTTTVFAPGALEMRLLALMQQLTPGLEIPLTLQFTNNQQRILRLKVADQ